MNSNDLQHLRSTWESLADQDPLWAILTLPGKKSGRWSVEAFFETGVNEVADVMRRLAGWGSMPDRRKALDFGCGVGRLTQALGDHFEQVVGVDISATMIERAREFNTKGDKCSYLHNPSDNLSVFPDGTFTFVYTNRVLQHIPRRLTEAYLGEFARILAPGGVLFFQLPSHASFGVKGLLIRLLPTRLLNWLRKGMEMNAIPRERIMHLLARSGLSLVACEPERQPGSEGWASFFYCARR
jgi:SAM-dependent methyltransferase